MDVVWVVVGVALLLLTLLDAFLAVLDYDEAGIVVGPLVRGQWLLLRGVTRRVGRRWRPVVLRQVTGILIVVTILWWVAGIVLGFTFIYLGAMGMSGAVVTSSGVQPDFLGAFYLSLGQFSTVGVDNIGPAAAVLNVVTVAEALISVILLSFIITFLGSVYGVIQSLQAWSADFFRAGRGIADPIDTLTPFFPGGRSRALDGQLDSILDGLTSYGHGLSQNRAAYYFQSGRDQFALPFALSMTAGVIGALRWGLPTGSDPASEPALLRLTDAFQDFRVRLQRALGWSPGITPAPVSAQAFAEATAAFGRAPAAETDPWVLRFLTIDRRMAELTRSDAAPDPHEAYRRYIAWLPFEFQAQSLLTAVSRDLDYQPIYRRIATTPDGLPIDGPGGGYELLPMDLPATAPEPAGPERPQRRGSWLRRRGLFIDPGLVRLSSAGRTIAGVVVAMGIAGALSLATGAGTLDAVILAGLVALFASPAAIGAPPGARRWLGLVGVVPTAAGLTIGALVPHDAWPTAAAMAVVAAAAVWLRRFGARAGGLGQLGFIAYYFSLMLALDLARLPAALAAGAVGLVCGWAAGLIPGPSLRRRVDAGIAALDQRIAYLLETTVDLASSARTDRRLTRTLRRQQDAVQQTAAAIAGSLDRMDVATPAAAHARDLAVRVFALRLAADNLVSVVPLTAGVAIAIEDRARLAADLVGAQRRLDPARSGSDAVTPAAPTTPAGPPTAPAAGAAAASVPAMATSSEAQETDVPTEVRRVAAAILELRTAADQLDAARRDFLSAPASASAAPALALAPAVPAHAAPPAAGVRVGADHDAAGRAVPDSIRTASSRQAVQAGLATGLSLVLGSLVSTSHQYWAAMPAFSVVSGSDGETRLRAAQRVAVTVLGAAIGFGLAILAGHSPAVAIPLLVVSVFFIAFLRPVSSVWAAFWQTLLFATVYDALGALRVETLPVRVVETVIGALVAVTVSALVLPTRTRARVLAAMSDVVRQAGVIAQRALTPVARRTAPGAGLDDIVGGDDAAGLDDDLRILARELAQLEELARPIRSAAGSLRRTGIEAQLTALWSIADDVRRVAADSTGGAETLVPAGLERRLAAATADNLAAVQAVLSRALPRRLQAHEDLDPGADLDLPADARLFVLRVLRLNQALLALIEAAAPGTVAAMTTGHAGVGTKTAVHEPSSSR